MIQPAFPPMHRHLRAATLLAMLIVAPAYSARDATVVADAVMEGQHDLVQSLLRQGADVNAAHGDGMSPLHWAAKLGDLESARMLLYAGANVKATSRIGQYTPLHLASRAGAWALVELLLENGSEPSAVTTSGTTPLMFGATSGSPLVAQALLDRGAQINQRETVHGQTALMFAAAANRADVVSLLMEHGADPALTTNVLDVAAQEKALQEAYKARQEKEERAKAEADAEKEAERQAQKKDLADLDDTSAEQAEPANTRVSSEDKEKSLEEGANDQAKRILQGEPEAKGSAKTKRTSRRAKKAQKEEGPKPKSYGELVGNHGGMTALHYAAREGHYEAAVALLEAGANVNQVSESDHTTPILIATLNGHFDLAMELLERGSDPCNPSDAGATPLYAAVNVQWAPHSFYPQPSPAQEKTSHLELMRALLERGADPNARLKKKVWYTGFNFDQSGVDESGATAFWRAAQAADVEAMRLLVEWRADPTIPSKVVPERRLPNGRNADDDLDKDAPKLGEAAVTPFQVATGAGYNANFHRLAPGGFLPAIRYFVEELGADVSTQDYRGYAPLHHAAARGDDPVIIYLLFHGADVRAVARSGETVADMANGPVQRIQPFPKTLAFLEAVGAKNNHNCVSC